MTAAPRHARVEAPWEGIARQDAADWFRSHPGAPWAEFYEWAETEWEPQQFLQAGHGWVPGRPVPQAALTEAHLGLAAAVEAEARRRGAPEMPLAGHRTPVERLAGPGATVRVTPWWDNVRDGAA